jgi:glucose-1-phosphate cytidylyltransferase
MKVVLFCGGQGLRLRDYSDLVPKPMVPIGYRPILWHLMRYYAHFGHNEFILCLGHKADVVKDYFLHYQEAISNDFVLSHGGTNIQLLGKDISNWKITFCDTGIESNIGQRLMCVKEHLGDDEMFLANYADGLSDVNIDAMVDDVKKHPGTVGNFIVTRPAQTFHTVVTDDSGYVTKFAPVTQDDVWVNGGFFCLRREIFDYMKPGDELVLKPFDRLIAERKLRGFKYEGFWACMDTFKEKQILDDAYARGKAPWELWKGCGNGGSRVLRSA